MHNFTEKGTQKKGEKHKGRIGIISEIVSEQSHITFYQKIRIALPLLQSIGLAFSRQKGGTVNSEIMRNVDNSACLEVVVAAKLSQ